MCTISYAVIQPPTISEYLINIDLAEQTPHPNSWGKMFCIQGGDTLCKESFLSVGTKLTSLTSNSYFMSIRSFKHVSIHCWKCFTIDIPYARHYNPRFVYFLPTFWRIPSSFCKILLFLFPQKIKNKQTLAFICQFDIPNYPASARKPKFIKGCERLRQPCRIIGTIMYYTKNFWMYYAGLVLGIWNYGCCCLFYRRELVGAK